MSTPTKDIHAVHQDQLYFYFYEEEISEERTAKECEFIIEQCDLKANQRVLDLACGHGRHSNYLAKQNLDVIGIDINTRFLEIAKEKTANSNEKLEFKEQNILEVEYENEFDAVILLFNTLGFFNEIDCKRLFKNISNSLKKGGKALVDCKNRDHFIKELVPAIVTEKNDDLMIDRISFNPVDGTSSNRRIYIKDGKRYDAYFKMFLYNFSALRQMALKNNLHIMKQFGSWDGKAFDSQSKRIILILEKV